MRTVAALLVLAACGEPAGTPIDASIDTRIDAAADAHVDAAPDGPPPVPPFELRVTPSGGGTITASVGSAIECGDTCSETFATPRMVTLFAEADSASRFLGWSGDCTGTLACVVLVDRARSVAATFSACGSLGIPSAVVGSSGVDGLTAVTVDSTDAVIAAGTLGDDIVITKRTSAGSAVWTRTLGGIGIDKAHAIVRLANDDIVVAGHFEETVAFDATSLSSTGFEDMFVVRLAGATGAVMWAKSFGGRYRDLALGLALATNGDVMLVGQFADPVAFGATVLAATYLDGVIARLAPTDGTVLWARSLGSIEVDTMSLDRAAGVAVTPADLVVVTGTTRSRADLGTGTLSKFDGTLDVFVAAYQGSNGAPVWSRLHGSQGDDHGRAIAVGADGGIYIGGDFGDQTADFGGAVVVDEPGPNPWGGGFVAKYDNTGAYQWSRSFSSSGLDSVASIVAAPGGVAVAGTFGRRGNLGTTMLTPAAESQDAYAALVASGGTVTWTRRIGERGNETGDAIALSSSGGLWLAGSFEDSIDLCRADGMRTPAVKGRDGFLVRLAAPATPLAEPLISPAPAPMSPVVPPGGTCPLPPPLPTSTPPIGPLPTFSEGIVALDTNVRWSDGIPIAADVDGDTDDDIVIGAFDTRPGTWGAVRVLRNTAGAFADVTTTILGGDRIDIDFPRDATAFDANGDGKTDVWFAEHGWDGPPFSGMNHGLVLSSATGMFDARYTHVPDERLFSHDVAHGDLDCDGDQDVIVTGERLMINDGTGHFVAEQAWRYPPDADHRVSSALWSEVCDVDRDGDLDILAGSGGQHMLYDVLLLNDGDGRFTRAVDGTLPVMSVPFGGAHNIVCADFDRDGWNDLYLERARGTSVKDELWLNRGDGTFRDASASAGFQVGVPQHSDVRAADLNGDGWIDLVGMSWLGSCGDESPIYLNQGSGTFVQLPFGVAAECRMVIPLHVGGDTKVDLWAMRHGTGPAASPSLYTNTTP